MLGGRHLQSGDTVATGGFNGPLDAWVDQYRVGSVQKLSSWVSSPRQPSRVGSNRLQVGRMTSSATLSQYFAVPTQFVGMRRRRLMPD
ncbi:MAG TPA: hypothetical protein PLM32_02820 [Candidatus Competibacter sp.]|nr:hypothetical protein [Candidatus Competibacter sp.]